MRSIVSHQLHRNCISSTSLEVVYHHCESFLIHANAWWYTVLTDWWDTTRQCRVDDMPLLSQWIKKERSNRFVLFWRPKQDSNLWQYRSEILSRCFAWSARIALYFFLFSAHFIRHRRREPAKQLTADASAETRLHNLNPIKEQKENDHLLVVVFFLAPQTGLEPVTPRLTAACSTDWAIRAFKRLA